MRAIPTLLGVSLAVLIFNMVTTCDGSFCTRIVSKLKNHRTRTNSCKKGINLLTASAHVHVNFAWCSAFEAEENDKKQKLYYFKKEKDRKFAKTDTCEACVSKVHEAPANLNDERESEMFLAAKQFLLKLKIARYRTVTALKILIRQYGCFRIHRKKCRYSKYRSIDGSCNNLRFRTWGMAETAQRRFAKADFDDDVSKPRETNSKGRPLPSARLVSNTMNGKLNATDTADDKRFTVFLPAFGQFLDHDITLTPELEGEEGSTIKCNGITKPFGNRRQCFPIKIPLNDPRFKGDYMEFVRSRPTLRNGVRQTVNAITAFIDGSNIYGSNDKLAKDLREGGIGAKLRVIRRTRSLPRGPDEDCNIQKPGDFCKKAGDIRVNEVSHLSMFHTCFVRLHNNIVRVLKSLNRHWNNERLYQEARKIIGAILQHITYAEFLPIILDKNVRLKFRINVDKRIRSHQYERKLDPSIRTEFSTAAFRFGHSLVQSNQACANNNFNLFFSKDLERDFFDPHLTQKCPAGIARWASSRPCKKMDSRFVGAVKDNLFVDSNNDAFDLVARNIQRGRDHGIPSYNEVRRALRLPAVKSYRDLQKIMGRENAKRLESAYRMTHSRFFEDIDLFAGGVSEKTVGEGILGPTFQRILALQFFNLKHGDRFWYETTDRRIKFTRAQIRVIKSVTLSKIMCDCFCLEKLQRNIFRIVRHPLLYIQPKAKVIYERQKLRKKEKRKIKRKKEMRKWAEGIFATDGHCRGLFKVHSRWVPLNTRHWFHPKDVLNFIGPYKKH